MNHFDRNYCKTGFTQKAGFLLFEKFQKNRNEKNSFSTNPSFHSSNENWLEISNKSESFVCPEVILY